MTWNGSYHGNRSISNHSPALNFPVNLSFSILQIASAMVVLYYTTLLAGLVSTYIYIAAYTSCTITGNTEERHHFWSSVIVILGSLAKGNYALRSLSHFLA
jgi:hypothetical protein